MRINITSPQGNMLAALGIAIGLLRKIGAPKERIDGLAKSVMEATSPSEARDIITEATNGAIEFYDPEDE